MKKLSLILLLVVTAFTANAGFVTGKYLGNGGASKAITGLGFRPEVILVKASGSQNGWIATSTMTTGYAKDLTTSNAPLTGYISSIDANGFTVANSQHSNAAGTTYYYVAWDDSDGSISVGSFTPNECASLWSLGTWYGQGSVVKYGSNNYKAIVGYYSDAASRPDLSAAKWKNIGACGTFSTSINTGYRPEMVWVLGEGANWDQTAAAQFVFDGPNANKPAHFNQGSYLANEEKIIADLNSSGFLVKPIVQPGTHNGTSNGTKYNYVTFKPSQKIITDVYTGTAVDNKTVTALAEQFVMVKNTNNTENTWFKTAAMGTDSSFKFTGGVSTQNVKKLTSTGFTVGYGGEVNGNGGPYEYFVMGASCPTVNISVTPLNPAIQPGASIQLTVSGASTYNWSPSSTLSVSGASATANPTSTTTYTVIGTDVNGCSGSASVTVTVNPIVILETNTNIMAEIIGSCPGDSTGSITLSGLDTTYTGTLSVADCSMGEIVSGNNITVNAGETKRIANTLSNINITINGGKLIVCASVSIANLTLNSGALINNGALVFNGAVSIPEEGAVFNNNGTMEFNSPATVTGLLFNIHGTATAHSFLTAQGSGQILNNSTFTNAQGVSLPINFNETEARKSENIITWSGTSQTGNSIRGLKPGTYTATIYNGSSKVQKTYTINATSAPSVQAVATHKTSEICNGSLAVIAAGGRSPYYYSWTAANDSSLESKDTLYNVCAGTYILRVFDANGCSSEEVQLTLNDQYIPPVDTNDNGGNNGNHEDTYSVVIDTVANLLKVAGLNAQWDLREVNFAAYEQQHFEDTLMNTRINPSTLRDYSTAYGETLSEDLPYKSYTGEQYQVDTKGSYSISTDAVGTLIIGESTYHNLKRIHVREKHSFVCSVGCTGIEADTAFIIIDSYYWFTSDTSRVPILTFRETTNMFAVGLSMFYQELYIGNESSSFDYEAFKELVNLQISPNPANSGNINISYNLPEDADISIALSNSLTGYNAGLLSTQQQAGIHSLSYNIDPYQTGVYLIRLTIDGVIVSMNLVISH
jgi:hypothetical protein